MATTAAATIQATADSSDSKTKIETLIKELNDPKEINVVVEFPHSVKIEEDDFKRIIEAVKKVSPYKAILFRSHPFNQKQQEAILSTLALYCPKESVLALELNRFDLTPEMIQLVKNISALERLRISGLNKIDNVDSLKLEELSQNNTLKFLEIYHCDSSEALDKIDFPKGLTQSTNLPQTPIFMNIKVILAFITANRLDTLALHDYNIQSSDIEAFRIALEKNTRLLTLGLQKTVNATGFKELLKRNLDIKFPSDKIRTEVKRGRKHLFYSKSLQDKFMDAFKHLSGKPLSEALHQLGFDPNGHCDDEVNPFINSFIAHEEHDEATKLIETFADQLDPNQRDRDEKTALIIAAKAYSADQEFLALLKCLKDKIDFNAQDDEGCTALHYLCAYGKTELIKELFRVASGKIDIHKVDSKGRTPLDIAKTITDNEVKSILESIAILPFRDSNAKRDFLWPQMKITPLNEDGTAKPSSNCGEGPVAQLYWLEHFNTMINDGKSPVYTDAANKDIWTSEYKRVKSMFSGSSIIYVSYLNRKQLIQSNLIEFGGGHQTNPTITVAFDKLRSAEDGQNTGMATTSAKPGVNLILTK